MKTSAHRELACLASLVLAFPGCEEEKATSSNTPGRASAAVTRAVSSSDRTRELYQDLHPARAQWYKQSTGKDATAETDHGSSGKQGRDVAARKQTDVAALSVEIDIDRIAKAGRIPANWRDRSPNNSVPYVSAVVFMVRKGNPKNVKDWE